MRTALKEPLHNISDNILNRVISKSIQADLRKYIKEHELPETLYQTPKESLLNAILERKPEAAGELNVTI